MTTSITPYRASKVITELLREDGITNPDGSPKEVRPQMMYLYCKKEYIKSYIDQDDKGKVKIKMEDLAEWYKRYSTNTSTSTNKVMEGVEILKGLLR